MNVLIFHPDEAVAHTLNLLFRSEDRGAANTSTYTDDDEDARHLLSVYTYDLVVIGDAGVDALQLIRFARDRKIETPIIIVSPDSSVERKVRMLEAGVDDYLVAPYHRDELLARSRVVVRRAQGRPTNTIAVGPIVIRDDVVTVNGERVHFTGHECSLLRLLATRKNTTVNKDTIMGALYPNDADEPESKIVDVYVCKIRAKLRDHGVAGCLQTAWGKGYVLTEVVGADATYTQFSAQNTIGRILALMGDKRPRLSAEVAAGVGIKSHSVQGRLSHMRVKGWLKNDIIRNGRARLTNWTITEAGLAELAERRQNEKRIKEAA